jgi:hypothetical protein
MMIPEQTPKPQFIKNLSPEFIFSFKKSKLSKGLKLKQLETKHNKNFFFKKRSDYCEHRKRTLSMASPFSKTQSNLFNQKNLTIEDSQQSLIHLDRGITSLKSLYPRKKIEVTPISQSASFTNEKSPDFNVTYTIGDSWKIKTLHNYLNPKRPITKNYLFDDNNLGTHPTEIP